MFIMHYHIFTTIMNIRHIILSASVAAMLASCTSTKTVLPYFTDISKVSEGSFELADYAPLIKPDDELMITVTSVTPEATAIYNLTPMSPAKITDKAQPTTTTKQPKFVVDSKGDINYPLLGKLHVAGMTVEQLQDELTRLISADVEDPHVMVTMVNFRVAVAGEVKQPRSIVVTRNRYSVLDALSDAGDLTPYGERSNVLLVREENGERKFVHLNLNSSDLLDSPYFYLRQNDYIYVQPNKVRQANSKYNQDNSFKLQVISTIVSATSVIASLVIALTVK